MKTLVLCCGSLVLAGCAQTPRTVSQWRAPSELRSPRPTWGAEENTAAGGWSASLLMEAGAGVRTVGSADLFPRSAGHEVIALDAGGRCHVLLSDNRRWEQKSVLEDGSWLGGMATGDVDARIDGDELYVASEEGHVYQVVPHLEGIVDGRFIGNVEGREVHTLVVGEFDSAHEGSELLAYTEPGGAYLLFPREEKDGFEIRLLDGTLGRIRDAVLVPNPGSTVTIVACASESGALEIHALRDGQMERGEIHTADSGRGRIALAPRNADDDPLVLYSICDDGRVFRHQQINGLDWTAELIHQSVEGLRGLVAGKFLPGTVGETVVISGDSIGAILLSEGRNPGVSWHAQPIYTGIEEAQWISSAELDGRNDTEELLLSGYSGRVVMLSRVPAEEF